MSGPVDVLAVLDTACKLHKEGAYADAWEVELERISEARAAVAELLPAAGGALSDLLAMVAAADRGEVWVTNAGTRQRIENLRAALAKFTQEAT